MTHRNQMADRRTKHLQNSKNESHSQKYATVKDHAGGEESPRSQGVAVGLTPVLFSISASEGRNVILRNAIGKIAANLSLILQFGDESVSPLQVIDGFADEGHRVGAYYLIRVLNVCFHETMSHPVALKLAQEWIKVMNDCEECKNVDVFDNTKTDVFILLSESNQRRSEVQFIRFFYSMFYSLNAFTKPVDFLLNKVLSLPMISDAKYARCVSSQSKESPCPCGICPPDPDARRKHRCNCTILT